MYSDYLVLKKMRKIYNTKASSPLFENSNLKKFSYKYCAVFIFSMFAFISASFAANVDLSLKQKISNSSPVIGQNITYTLTLKNSGLQAATNIVVADKIPLAGVNTVVGLPSALSSWAYNATTGIGTWTVPNLAPGDSILIAINVKVIDSGVHFNVAEVFTSPDTDIDSTPGNQALLEDDIASSCFSVPIQIASNEQVIVEIPAAFKTGAGISWFRNGLPITSTSTDATINPDSSLTINTPGNYTYTSTKYSCSLNAGGCCPIIVQASTDIFDLALRKTLVNATPVYPGSKISYKIDVFNQGTQLVTNVVVRDYIPAGLVLDDIDWTQVGNDAVFNNPNLIIAAGESVPLTINFKVSDSFVGTSIINSAEISSAKGTLGQTLVDVDSDLDAVSTNDGVNIDNEITQNGKTGGDQDDFDIATLAISQLATLGNFVWNDANANGIQDATETGIAGVSVRLENPDGTLVASTTTDASGNYTFTKVTPGTYVVSIATPATFVNTTLNSGSNTTIDSDINPVNGKTASFTLISGQINNDIDAGFTGLSCPSITLASVSKSSICIGDSALITATSSNNTAIQWYSVPSGGSLLFTSNSNVGVSVKPTANTVYYAQLATIAQGCPTTRTPVNVNINPKPNNPVVMSPIEICTDSTVNLNSKILGGLSTSNGVFEWHTGILSSSPLVVNPLRAAAGSYYLFEKSALGCYSNASLATVITKSCTNTVDVALLKTADKRVVNLNDNIVYTYEITNEGLNTATNIKIEDKLPIGLVFVSSTTLNHAAGVITKTIPSLAPGQSIFYSYTAKAVVLGNIINLAQVVAVDQKDIDSSPNNALLLNEDDDDDEVINVVNPNPTADLSLAKFSSASKLNVNDNVTYTITIKNAGPNIATNVQVKDIIPAGLQLISAIGGDVVTTVKDTVLANFNEILVGSEVDLFIVAKVTKPGFISNRAEVSKSDLRDPDSVPNTGSDEDDDDISTIEAIEPCNPTVPLISASNSFICPSESLILTASGCTGTVLWSNNATGITTTVSPTTSTVYTAKCQVGLCISAVSNSVQINVGNVAPPIISANSNTVCPGGSVTLTASSCSGTITWSTGATGNSISVSPTANSTVYTAVCKVATCTSNNSNPVTITLTTLPTAPTIVVNKTTVCVGETVSLTASACSGTVTWSNNQTGATITPVISANTTYTATCAVGSCISSLSNALSITTSPAPTPSITASKDATCGSEPITLTAGNCTGTLLWSTGATTASITVIPTATTNYTLKCTVGSCEGTANKSITVGALGQTPVITANKSSICVGDTARLTATSCSGTLTWANSTALTTILGTGLTYNATPQVTTTYTATCTSGTCTGFANVTITVNPKPSAPIITAGANNICAGDSVTITSSNCTGTTIWSNGAQSSSIKVKPTTTTNYTATCSVNACVSVASTPVTITVNTKTPTITASADAICLGDSVTLTAGNCTGGAILWNTGATTAIIKAKPSAQTIYTVTCSVGTCTANTTKTISINAGQTPTLTASSNNVCAGTSVTITAANCTASLIWSSGQTTAAITVTPTVKTTYTATCGTGVCAKSASTEILVNPAQTPTISATKTTVCASETVTLTSANCSGGLLWSTGATSAAITVTPSATTTYTVTCGTGACAKTATQEITVGVQPDLTVAAVKTTICAGESVAITATNCAIGLTWSNGATGNTITVSPTANTTYTATCAATTCKVLQTKSVSIVVNANTIPTPTVLALTNTCPSVTVDLSKAVTNTVQTGNSFVFKTGNTIASASVVAPNAVAVSGDYYVFETATSGCSSAPANIKVNIKSCTDNPGDADVQVTISVNKLKVERGDTVTYTIRVKNNGPAIATNVKLNNVIPRDLTLVAPPTGWAVTGTTSGTTIATTIASMPIGSEQVFTYKAKLIEAGTFENIVTKLSADQNDPVVVNNVAKIIIECASCAAPCISTALNAKREIEKLADGSYIVRFTSVVRNCGNTLLDSVDVIQDLGLTFNDLSTFSVLQAPRVSGGSELVPNPAFNGTTNKSLLTVKPSRLLQGRADTIYYAIKVQPKDINKIYLTDSEAKGVAISSLFGNLGIINDFSNDGVDVFRDSTSVTKLKFFKLPGLALAKYIEDTVKQANGTYNIRYRLTVKNSGELDLSNVVLSDSLNDFKTNGVNFTIAIAPTKNTSSLLAINPAYNGRTDSRLTLSTSTLALGKVDTVRFTINVTPGSRTRFTNQAYADGTSGTLPDGTPGVTRDPSTTGTNPDAPGKLPTVFTIKKPIVDSVCIGTALTFINKVKQTDGTYNVTYQAIIKNCGNVALSNIVLCDTLLNTFPSPVAVKVIGDPIVSPVSAIKIDTSFDGKTKYCMILNATSTMAAGKTDTIRWTINVQMNGNQGPFSNNVTVSAQDVNNKKISDVSNDGINPNPQGQAPTIISFDNNLKDTLIGLAKRVVKIDKVPSRKNVFDVNFEFVIKNYGKVALTNIQLQDNLAQTFGDLVTIDSVGVKADTGLVANKLYTGKGSLIDVLNDSLSKLGVGETKKVKLLARVDMSKADSLKYENYGYLSGFVGTKSFDDPSADGENPDADLSGSPSNDSKPTPIDFTGLLDLNKKTPLGIAKQADTLASTNGNYIITYKILVKNYGTAKFDSIQLIEDLQDVFSTDTTFSLIGKVSLNDSSKMKLDTTFNGRNKKNLLIAKLSSLAVGKSDTIIFKVKVKNYTKDTVTFLNSVKGSAWIKDSLVKDESQNGLNPDKNGDTDPGNDNVATPVKLAPAVRDTTDIVLIVRNGLVPGGSVNNYTKIKNENNGVELREEDNIAFYVYNRWGALVFKSDNYIKEFKYKLDGEESGTINGWEGQANQGIRIDEKKYVSDGTYFYVITSTNPKINKGKPLRGFITVIR